MSLVVAALVCAYIIGTAWAARILFRGMMHERHMAVHYLMGDPPAWWEYPLSASAAFLWPVPMLVYLVIDFFSMDDR